MCNKKRRMRKTTPIREKQYTKIKVNSWLDLNKSSGGSFL
jgi:hypothetical protein